MPLIFLLLLIGLPILDIYATLRLAESLGVPGIALFVPGVIFGVMIMKRETRQFRARFVGAVQSMALHSMVFDSGRRMLAALLFLLPGFVSDVFALFLILIPNRSFAFDGSQPDAFSAETEPPRSANPPRETAVVDGEYRRVE